MCKMYVFLWEKNEIKAIFALINDKNRILSKMLISFDR